MTLLSVAIPTCQRGTLVPESLRAYLGILHKVISTKNFFDLLQRKHTKQRISNVRALARHEAVKYTEMCCKPKRVRRYAIDLSQLVQFDEA